MIQGLQKQLQKTYDGTTTYAYNYGMPWDSVLSNESVVGANWFFAMGGFGLHLHGPRHRAAEPGRRRSGRDHRVPSARIRPLQLGHREERLESAG